MWELDHEESWVLKNWCSWTVVLEKTLESPLDHKEMQPVYPKGDQSWVFFGRTDVEAETPILWPPDSKSWLIWKYPDAGKDWGQEEKGTTEDEMVGWHHRLDGHGFGWTLGVGDRQGGLACLVHGVAKSRTQLSDWTELNICTSVKHRKSWKGNCRWNWDFLLPEHSEGGCCSTVKRLLTPVQKDRSDIENNLSTEYSSSSHPQILEPGGAWLCPPPSPSPLLRMSSAVPGLMTEMKPQDQQWG